MWVSTVSKLDDDVATEAVDAVCRWLASDETAARGGDNQLQIPIRGHDVVLCGLVPVEVEFMLLARSVTCTNNAIQAGSINVIYAQQLVIMFCGAGKAVYTMPETETSVVDQHELQK
jgi:hypothetical protein